MSKFVKFAAYLLSYDGLTEEEKEEFFGWEKEERGYLAIEWPGEEAREIKSDGGEPEDNSYWRDWNWVADYLNKAAEAGKREVIENVNQG